MKPVIDGNNGNKYKSVPASIEKLSPFILAKLLKKVNQISKFFKNLKQVLVDKTGGKSYV